MSIVLDCRRQMMLIVFDQILVLFHGLLKGVAGMGRSAFPLILLVNRLGDSADTVSDGWLAWGWLLLGRELGRVCKVKRMLHVLSSSIY